MRLALGARRLHIVRLVTHSAFWAVLGGSVIGIILDLVSSRIFGQWTNGDSRDPAMLAIVVAVLSAAAGLASLGPAIMATSIAPNKALQAE